jgi:YegS/Rv2252/BmrU family lipid kinase
MNDNAGKFKFTPGVEDMKTMIEHLDLRIDVIGTKSEQHMIQTLRELIDRGVERVAVAGGDGTVTTAIQMLARCETALGIIPQGTANNFATALRLPQDLPSALRVLQEGEIVEVDLGKSCGRYFAESAGVGLFADALSLYGRDSNKNVWRSFLTVCRLIFGLRPHRLMLTIDGVKHEEPAVFCVAANSFRMAHALAVAPSAKLTDGELDLVILGNLDRKELFSYYKAMRQQMHITLPKVKLYRAKEVRIEARRRMPVHSDDKVPCTTPVTITAEHKALKVIVERL